MKFKEMLKILKSEFVDSGDFAKSEAEEIIEIACKYKKSDIYLNKNTEIPQEQFEKIQEIAKKHKNGKPLAYCSNSAYFYDREFFINQNVLIPRFDTEILVETVLKNENTDEKFILELGAGSGIICEILQANRKSWKVLSVDFSQDALKIAKIKSNEKILLVNSDRFSAISEKKQFDIIVSNPPYIESETIKTLDCSVKNFEPIIAIDGGETGLVFYEYMAESAKLFLKNDGMIYVEIGYNQSESVSVIFKKNGLKNINIIKDFGGNPRVISAQI
jgi:release factor glutamine methyltransferase